MSVNHVQSPIVGAARSESQCRPRPSLLYFSPVFTPPVYAFAIGPVLEHSPVSFWSLPASRRAELMDDPALPEPDHLKALSALARINAFSRTAARIAGTIAAVWGPRSAAAEPFTVVDVACGGGDVTVDLARRLTRISGGRGVGPVRVVGIDISPRAIDRAHKVAAARGVDVEFLLHDVTEAGCPDCDLAVSSLFLHHLDDAAAVCLLRALATAARRGIVVSDLVRSRIGLALAVVGTTVLSTSRVARVDGPLSVRAARTPGEYRRLLDAAGLATATISRCWPERVLITWSRPAAEPLARAS